MKHYQKKLIIVLNLVSMIITAMPGIAAYADSGTKLNMNLTRENFTDFCDSLVIPEEKQKLKLDPLYFNNFDLLNNSYDYKDIFSMHNDKFQPGALQAIRKKQAEEDDMASDSDSAETPVSAPTVYNVSLSGKQQGVKTISLNGSSQNSFMYSMINTDDKSTQFNFDMSVEKVKAAISQKDFSSAEDNLSFLRAKSKGNNAHLFILAGLYEKISQPEEACGIYKEITDSEPAKVEYLYSYAVCLYKNNQEDLAEKNFLKITELKPDFMYAYYNLGNLYYKKSDYYKALDYFNKAMEINPANADVYFNIGVTLENLDRKTLAKKYYSKCFELNPEDKQAENAVARLD